MPGDSVISCEHVMLLALQKRSIYHSGMRKALPAAFFIGWPAKLLIDTIKGNYLTIYIKQSPKK